jgi:serine/threonine protein kinase/formylglycine-generating enzyme required for sulfatase activity
MSEDRVERIRRLASAVRLHLDFKAAATGDPEVLLRQNDELRELLEPMLAAGSEAAVTGRVLGDFAIEREVGRGGMGVVYEARQVSLGRHVALKVLSPALQLQERALWRFQREARLLARLDHPGIVKVFEAGEADGMPFYAMEFVVGAPLGAVIVAVRRHGLGTATGGTVAAAVCGAETAAESTAAAEATPRWRQGYLQTVVDLALQIAEALAFAHAAGIVHRDVKPANVLVRRDGTALLGDFGIARQEDLPSMTLTGDFAGTPFYVSPEQARADHVDHRTDVFSLGVTLYELVSLQRPFTGTTSQSVLQCIQQREPVDPKKANPSLPADLAAIVLKALEKDPGRRYQSAGEMAADLRAFLEDRPVSARRPSRLQRALRWVRREPLKAGFLATVFAAIVTIAVVSFVLTRQLLQKGDEARQALTDYERLAIGVRLQFAQREARQFKPVRAEHIKAMEHWLQADAAPLAAALPPLREELAGLRGRALPYTAADKKVDAASHPQIGRLALLRRELADLRRHVPPPGSTAKAKPDVVQLIGSLATEESELVGQINTRRTFRFARDSDQFLHDQLVILVGDLTKFVESPDGTMAFVREQLRWGKESRQRCAVDAAAAWQQAIAEVAQSRLYGGMRMRQQTDLVPIGADPASGLMEFVHLRSGAEGKETPARGTDGRLVITDATGIVFVLVPGGSFLMGAQTKDPAAPNYDPGADVDEAPVNRVSLATFFLAKYEMTQAQWRCLSHGDKPSLYAPGTATVRPWPLTEHNPVENVAWNRAADLLADHGLDLPTEAQWEYACRAGTSTRWSFGNKASDIGRYGNICDASVVEVTNWPFEQGVNDHFVVHAPVGSFLPNAWGFFDMHGNVYEWCRDVDVPYHRPCDPKDGLREQRLLDSEIRCLRGGSFHWIAQVARCSERFAKEPGFRDSEVGLRPARAIEP